MFTWLPKGGKHNLKFIVDPPTSNKPNGRVLESAEDNNQLLLTKKVAGEDSIPGLTMPLMVLALLGAIFIAALTTRRRR